MAMIRVTDGHLIHQPGYFPRVKCDVKNDINAMHMEYLYLVLTTANLQKLNVKVQKIEMIFSIVLY